ncbi:MAG: ABC transporter permease [Actinobacteria bacterium]|nr:ABC transporter permease [Actinomycetota bacterium]
MLAFATRRALSGLLLIASLTFLTFLVFNTIPTKPACLVVACGPHTSTSDAEIKAADHRLGIDRPVIVQYGKFVWHLVRHGDLGTSWTQPGEVRTQILTALPVTASLVAGGMILMFMLALGLGCFSALRPRSLPDRGLLALTVVGLAVHPFVLGIGLRKLFANHLGAPSSGYCSLRASYGCSGLASWTSHLAVPWLVFALLFLPLYMRLIRARLLEALHEPWIATARAKGASEPRVVLGHALRNAIGPVLPLIAIDAGTAITAAIYIETVFGLRGLGNLAVQAFSGQAGGYDLPLTVGLVTTVGVFVVALNLASDLAGAWLDPRLRMQHTLRQAISKRLVANPRARIALAATVVVLATTGAFLLGQLRGTNRDGARQAIKTLTPNLIDSFPLPGGASDDKIHTRVSKLEVSATGWRVYASITNASNEPLLIFQPNVSFGIVYPHEGMSLVVSPTAADRAAGIRRYTVLAARSFDPAIPRMLLPHQTWSGSFGSSDAVPKHKAIYVGYGAFFPGSPGGAPISGSYLTARTIVIR